MRCWKDRRIRLDLPSWSSIRSTSRERPIAGIEDSPRRAHRAPSGQLYPLAESEIDELGCSVINGLKTEPYPYLSARPRARMKRGPLAGAEAILVRKKNLHRRGFNDRCHRAVRGRRDRWPRS